MRFAKFTIKMANKR